MDISKIFDLIFSRKRALYLVCVFSLIISFFTTFWKIQLLQFGLDVSSIKHYTEYESFLFIISLLAVIFIIIYELYSRNQRRITNKNLKNSLTQIGEIQRLILIECFKKQERFFNYETLRQLEETIDKFNWNFQTHINPLIASNVIKQRDSGLHSAYEVVPVIWKELENKLPHYRDLAAYDKIKNELLNNELDYFKRYNYKQIPLSFLDNVENMRASLKEVIFSDAQTKKELGDALVLLKKISEILSPKCYVNRDNKTFTIYFDGFSGTVEQRQEIDGIVKTILASTNELKKLFDTINSRYDSFAAIERS